ncbi:MAG: EAL domain-containing protein [Pseudomonadota bacterium]
MQALKPTTLALLLALSTMASGTELAVPAEPPFRLYSVTEGLNQRTILKVVQDEHGYLWIATFGGLNRFDGQTFESFTTRQGLRNNLVQGLLVDRQNRLWAGDAGGGLTLLEDGRVVRTFDPANEARGFVRSIIEFGDELLIGVEPGGLQRLRLGAMDAGLEHIPGTAEDVQALVADTDANQIYLLSGEALLRYDSSATKPLPRIADGITVLIRSPSGQVTVGSADGRVGRVVADGVQWQAREFDGQVTGITFDGDEIAWVTIDDQHLVNFTDPSRRMDDMGLGSPAIIDQEGILWAPTRGGLARYLGTRFRHYGLEVDGIQPEVFAIQPGTDGDFWFGTDQGLLRVDAQGVISNVSKQLAIPITEVRGVSLSDDGSTLWMVQVQGVAYEIDIDTLTAKPFLGEEPLVAVGLELASDGRLWTGTYFGTLHAYDPRSGETQALDFGSGAALYAMDSTADGHLWVAANFRGLYRVDTTRPGSQPELMVPVEEIGRDFYTQLVVDPHAAQRTVWLASVEGGVFRWRAGKLDRLQIDEALGDYTVYALHPLADGTLVLATSRGAYRYNPEDGHLEHYSALDGFVSIEAKAHATYFEAPNTLWIGTTSGVTAMDVEQPMSSIPQPRPLISRRLVDGEAVSAEPTQTTRAPHGNLFVEYAAISTRRPGGIEYSYRLDHNGAVGAWSAPTTTQSIGYSNLPSGQYDFAVRSRLPGGDWSKAAQWSFVVPTPFWRTYWFTALAAAVALLLTWSIVQLRLRVVAGANRRLRQQVAERTASIEAGRRELELINDQLSSEIHERKRADALRADVEERFHQAYQNSPIGMALVDTEGLVYDANPPLQALFWPHAGEDDRQPLLEVVIADQRETFTAFLDALAKEDDAGTSMEVDCLTHDGQVRRIDFLPSPVRDADGEVQYLVMLAQDVTESHAMTSKLAYQAHFDELTGLLNRRAFAERLALVNATTDGAYLLFLDLDQFKVVNDTCGHTAGDELLRLAAKTVSQAVRPQDTVARLGGDEFALILMNCTQQTALDRAEQIRRSVQALEFPWETEIFRIGVSIGIVPINDATSDLNELQQLADAACYAAKEAGRNRVHLVSGTEDAVHEHRGEMRWVQRLNHAIDTDSFVLFGQRLQQLADGPVGSQRIEILLRMLDRSSGRLIPPSAFLPAAERYGLQGRLDQWVVNRVIDLLSVQDSDEVAAHNFWVNLSGASVGDRSFSDALIERMRASDLPAGCMNFEITETAVIRKIDDAAHLMSALQEMGCRFALDDFGSGLSSFGYLKRLHVDYVKVDGQFVRDIVTDPTDRIFVKSIIDIAHTLDKRVVCEFVEDDEILEMVGTLGGDYAQGYGVHRPQPLDELLGVTRATSEDLSQLG